jgi:KilA-N domain
MEKIQEFTFGGQPIHFEKENTDIMINAAEMARQFGKTPKDFLRTESTKNFISELSGKENLPIQKIFKVVEGGKHQGTWMHRKLALKFAGWLSPKFELWVYDVIEEILFGDAKTLRTNNDELRIITNRMKEIDQTASVIFKERYQLAKKQKQLLLYNTTLLN